MTKAQIQTLKLQDVLESYRVGIDPKRFPGEDEGLILRHNALHSEWLYANLGEGEPCGLRGEMDKRRLKRGDIVATVRFSQFHAAIAPKAVETDNVFAYCNLMVLVPNKEVVDPQYLALWLRSGRAIAQIKDKAKVPPNINKSADFFSIGVHDLTSIYIHLPSIEKQVSVVSDYLAMLTKHEEMEDLIRREKADFQYKLF